MTRTARLLAGVATLVLAALCSATAADAFDAHGSVNQVYATGLPANARMALVNAAGRRVARKRADPQGGVLFRNVKAGSGYRLRGAPGSSGPLTVLSKRPAPPSTDIYNQSLPSSGYGYLTTRDGTKLAIYVHPPQDVLSALPGGVHPPGFPDGIPAIGSGPFRAGPAPTLIEYSGYGYADPAGPQNSIAAVANLFGFTVVDVNMRGTGCSGGAFDFFEPLQSLDGYDVIETVARQPWVLHHKVGMMGISYGGISQLFTAQLRPPSLLAIAPLSVIDHTETTLYPGGILNTGFAVAWAKERIHDAKPAGPNTGQPWAWKRIQEGDETCRQNQALHGQAVDLMHKIRANSHYVPKVADPLAPITFVHKIDVPVFMACQWTDEQTGGHCPTLAEHMTGTSRKWFTYTNGTHVDSLDPETYNRWYDFLQLYVAQQAPITNTAVVQASAPVVYQAAMNVNGVTLPPDPVQQQPTYDGARAMFEAFPSVRILFDNGAGRSPGQPYPGFERSFSSFPIPGTAGRAWYLSPGGALRSARPRRDGADKFTWNPHARPLTDFTGDTGSGDNGLWTATPPYRWLTPPAGSAASYVTPPLARTTTVIGAGQANLWVRSPTRVVDLQVTVSEVRPDGKETFVQSGWLRSSFRKLDPRKSKPLEPWPSGLLRDLRAMPRGRFAKLVVPLYYEGHVYRAGSRIRVTITAPNGDQPIWSFSETKPKTNPTVVIARAKDMPSSVVLPVVPGVDVPTGLPPCPGLRGEPCRTYQRYVNQSARLARSTRGRRRAHAAPNPGRFTG